MNLDNYMYDIDIPEDAEVIRFVEVPEEGASTQTDAETVFDMYNIEISKDAKLITFNALPEDEETGFILHVKKTFPQLDKRKIKLHGVQRNGFCDLKLKSM